MKKLFCFGAVCAAVLTASPALADPSMRTSTPGSAIFVYVSNPEDRAYSCTISYNWAHDSFGNVVSGNDSFQVSVPAKAPEFQARKFSGSYVNLRLTDSPVMHCNPN